MSNRESTAKPKLELLRALLRGRYMCAAARMEWQGTPIDTEMLTELQANWEWIRRRLAQAVNRTYPVFVPTGSTLAPNSRLGAAILRTAAQHNLDPYHLAVTVERVWRETLALYTETINARREARARTGLTASLMARWENAGHDASSWPGLDDMAAALAEELPALGLRDTGPDAAGALWDLLRTTDDRYPQRQDPTILNRAVELALDDPEGLAWDGSMSFSTERFAQYLMAKGIPWPRLASGDLALDDRSFRDMARAFPTEIGPIREVRHTLSALKLRALTVGSDGRNRCLLSAFRSKSSRNQPSNSAYVFGPSTWLRSLIKPEPGRAVAYVDWSQQELAIAAYLSGDKVMQDAYVSGDFYLSFAIRAGAAPPNATKATHSAIREQFKTLCLGVQYGLSEYGLARRLEVPLSTDRQLLQYHKEVFKDYWAWSDQVEMQGMLGGTLWTVFGWQMHTGPHANPRSLRNFPMQSHGSEMLRLACCLCTEHGIHVCGPVHDAILVESSIEAIESIVAQTQRFMEQASLLVLPGFPLRTEAKIVPYPERYQDPRGVQMWETVQSILEETREEVPF